MKCDVALTSSLRIASSTILPIENQRAALNRRKGSAICQWHKSLAIYLFLSISDIAIVKILALNSRGSIITLVARRYVVRTRARRYRLYGKNMRSILALSGGVEVTSSGLIASKSETKSGRYFWALRRRLSQFLGVDVVSSQSSFRYFLGVNQRSEHHGFNNTLTPRS